MNHEGGEHCQPIRHTQIPPHLSLLPSFYVSSPYQPSSITRNCNSRNKRKQTQCQLAKFELDSRFSVLDSRFSICDSRFDSIRFTASAFYFATSAGWNCVCNLFYYIFPSNNIRLGCSSSGSCCSCPASASFVKVQLSSKSRPEECLGLGTKETRENSITQRKTGCKLKIKICPKKSEERRLAKKKKVKCKKKGKE